MNILTAKKEELRELQEQLLKEYGDIKSKNLKLNMARGKPGSDQLDLCEDMLTVISKNEQMTVDGVDTRNYGGLEGIMSCRELFGDLLDVPAENVLAGGNASLTMMYDNMMRLWIFGAAGVNKPWGKQEKIKWLCPAPGYDRHFAICQQLGMEMVVIPMLESGPDMDMIEKLVASDSSIKGIWCVPKYSNPEGISYSDETVRRFAALKTAAEDFKIFWDNAYCVHHLSEDKDEILNLFTESKKLGTEDRVFVFASTSKISYPGAGVACMVCSDANMEWTKKILTVQAIGPDKINQLRHVAYFKNAAGVAEHMKKHAAILKPKFDMVISMLNSKIAGTSAGSWHNPKGGYFVSYDAMPGCAKRIHQLCKEAGLNMTGAGATFPLGKDPKDSNLRIAPSYPTVDELKLAMELFCNCALLAAVEKQLAN